MTSSNPTKVGSFQINKVHNMDCIEGMKKLEKNSIDLIVTSPPYNIGIKYNSHKDDLPFSEYLDWMKKFGKVARGVLKEEGSLFFNIGDKPSDKFRSFKVAEKISENFEIQNTIHWVKHIAAPEEDVNIGHYKPVNSKRYLNNCHEYIFHFTPEGKTHLDKLSVGVPYADKSNIGRWKEAKQDKRDRGNMWFIPYKTVNGRKPHPAAFPLKLPKMCIKLHGFNKNTVVLDSFMGSGTTALAAKELGCKYIGFEIDERYIEIAKKRITENHSKLSDY